MDKCKICEKISSECYSEYEEGGIQWLVCNNDYYYWDIKENKLAETAVARCVLCGRFTKVPKKLRESDWLCSKCMGY